VRSEAADLSVAVGQSVPVVSLLSAAYHRVAPAVTGAAGDAPAVVAGSVVARSVLVVVATAAAVGTVVAVAAVLVAVVAVAVIEYLVVAVNQFRWAVAPGARLGYLPGSSLYPSAGA